MKPYVTKNKEIKLEKVPLLVVYKQDGNINLEYSDDTHMFEIYGYLKLYLKILEEELLESFEEKE